MHHTVTNWHGVTLHDAPVMIPLAAIVLAVVVFVLIPLWVKEVRRAEALADVATLDATSPAAPDVAA